MEKEEEEEKEEQEKKQEQEDKEEDVQSCRVRSVNAVQTLTDFGGEEGKKAGEKA